MLSMRACQAKVEQVLLELGARQLSHTKDFIWQFELPDGALTWQLELWICDWNFLERPIIRTVTPGHSWGWPHVSKDGQICISDDIGLEYDPDDIEGLLRWLLNAATRLLRADAALLPDARLIEFADELEGYVNALGAAKIRLDENLSSAIDVYAEVVSAKGKRGIEIAQGLTTGAKVLQHCKQRRLALLDVQITQLPALSETLNQDWFHQFYMHLSAEQMKLIRSSSIFGMLLRVPNRYGQALLLIYWGRKGLGISWPATVYRVERRDRDYLLQRTGGHCLGRHVVIAGIGSIGSRVAELLALAGIKKLTLLDTDRFSADNLGRHVLGQNAIGRKKVEAMKALLENRMPGIEVISGDQKVQDYVAAHGADEIDTIVLATGNGPLERGIVRQAFRDGWQVLLVSTSVEACGLGGHAIAMRPGQSGCLECLHIDTENQQPMGSMRGGLVAPEQVISRQLTGCNAFAPYSAIDATQTALLASKVVLNGESGYHRWIGEEQQAHEAGVQVSPIYKALRAGNAPLHLAATDYAQPRCSCCGS